MSNLPREEALFTGALALPAASRLAFLQAACPDDAALQQHIVALLREHEDAGGALDAEPPRLSADLAQALRGRVPVEDLAGTKVGRYKLLQKLGEGGCGVVFMAQQDEPVRRRVALKVIKLGMDTREVIARFEAERQALALMDHPNIAHVLDAGATETGRPYFVMELVRGIPITRHCDENHLGTAERLKLFVQICHAVQHAHQKGIIHRDLKPSNILVTLHDGVPVPKIIDFGIAKATQGRLTDKTLFTAFEQFIGTPAYMSPEQTEMSGLDVDTRSDIYSLGVLLYELLTGRTPFETQDLLKSGLDEMRRTIREKEPLKPSARVSTLDAATCANLARQRGIDAPQLRSALRGDLDWIVMRCLEKNRTRRYETADGLANDIERYLRSEPVAARPPSTAYVLQKLVRRNKLAFAAASGIVGALALGLVFATWGLQRERAARAQAESEKTRSAQVARFMKDMLAGVGPQTALGRDTKMLRAILDETVEGLPRKLQGQPEVEADLRETLGHVYRDLEDFRSAAFMHDAALKLRRQALGAEHTKVADSLHHLGDVLARQNKLAEATTTLRAALAMREKIFGYADAATAASRATLAGVLRQAGASPHQADVPAVIRLGHTGGRSTGETYNSGDLLTTVHQLGALEREFQREGIRIEWDFFGGGPATNNAFSLNSVDFASQASVAAIPGRAAGLRNKLLLRVGGNGAGGNYLVVRADSPFRTAADLKGRKFGSVKGTGGHLALLLTLEKLGFTERDFEILDFENAAGVQAALLTGGTDACYMSRPFDQVARGRLRIVHDMAQDTDAGADPDSDAGPRGVGVFWVSEDFETRHPLIVQRVVNTIVATAAWSSAESNRDAIFQLREKAGWSQEEFDRAWTARPLKERYSPFMDEGFFAALRRSTGSVKRFGFMPADAEPSIGDWTESKYLHRALVDLKLENYWPELDAAGKPKRAPPRSP